MKNLKDKLNINTLLIIILGALLLFQRECSGDKHQVINNYHKAGETKYFYDSIVHKIQVPVPVLLPGQSIPYPVPADVDTAAILQKYFTANYYTQSISDSNLIVIIHDTIKENHISGRGFYYKWIQPVKIETYKPKEIKQRLKVFAGLQASASLQGINSLGPEVIIVTKKDHAYKVNYDLLHNGIGLGTYWKIKLKHE